MKITNDIKSAVDTAEIFNRTFAQVSALIEFLNGIMVSLPPNFSSKEDAEAVLNCLEALHKIKKRCNQDALRERIKNM